MITSAQSLGEVFTAITMKRGSPERFLSVAADVLGLKSEDREAEALLYLSRSIKRVERDIESLPFEENQKNLLRNQISVFFPIADFSHAHLSVDQALGNSLSDKNLVGLMHINMALHGKAPAIEFNPDAKVLAEQFRATREDVSSSDLPQSAKALLINRINQIAAVLDHLAFFGVDDLEKELANLAGSLLLQNKVISQKSPGIGKRILSLLGVGIKVVETANKTFDQSNAAVENGTKAYEMIEKMFY
jgi:hypothetical protein